MQYDGSESFEDLFNHFLAVNYKGTSILSYIYIVQMYYSYSQKETPIGSTPYFKLIKWTNIKYYLISRAK